MSSVRLVHGPTFHCLATKVDEETRESVRAVLMGQSQPARELKLLHGDGGKVTGRLTGGNLTVLASMAGTRWQPRSRENIVMLEDITELGYRLDRSLTQLRLSGAFDGAEAFVLGQFTRCPLPEGANFTLEEMLADVLKPIGRPIYSGLPIGHERKNISWVYCAHATIENAVLQLG